MGKLLAINTEELIQGEKFKNLDNGVDIFYRDTHLVNQFFDNPPKNKFVLVSHNSDGKIKKNDFRFSHGSSNDANIANIPNNLVKWYGQNVCVNHEKIISIPIGLENSEWFPNLKKKEKIIYYSNKKSDITNLLFICHNINTNINERRDPYILFKDISWVTLINGMNGLNFDTYLKNIKSHKFVLCPEGNGTDTHRTWETLYLGSIPIEKRNLNNKHYQDLPICFIDNWSDINEDFLNSEYERITNQKWNLEKLNFNFWCDKIKNEIKK